MKLSILISFCILFATGNVVHGLQLLLGTDPINSPDIIKKELKPLLDAMKAKYKMAYIPAFTPEELLLQARLGKINSAYVTPGYGYLLQQIGFVPLLVSKEQLSMSLVGKPNFDIAVAKNNSDQKIYFTKNDLFSRFRVHKGKFEDQWAAEVIATSTSENIIFKLLKERSSLGFVMDADLGLLDKELRDNLAVYDRENIGPLYFFVNSDVMSEWPNLKGDLYSFHKDFKDPEMRYNYLNVYHFEYADIKKIELHSEYRQYLEMYQK